MSRFCLTAVSILRAARWNTITQTGDSYQRFTVPEERGLLVCSQNIRHLPAIHAWQCSRALSHNKSLLFAENVLDYFSVGVLSEAESTTTLFVFHA
jgi:hypothetical protein